MSSGDAKGELEIGWSNRYDIAKTAPLASSINLTLFIYASLALSDSSNTRPHHVTSYAYPTLGVGSGGLGLRESRGQEAQGSSSVPQVGSGDEVPQEPQIASSLVFLPHRYVLDVAYLEKGTVWNEVPQILVWAQKAHEADLEFVKVPHECLTLYDALTYFHLVYFPLL